MGFPWPGLFLPQIIVGSPARVGGNSPPPSGPASPAPQPQREPHASRAFIASGGGGRLHSRGTVVAWKRAAHRLVDLVPHVEEAELEGEVITITVARSCRVRCTNDILVVFTE